MSFERHLHSETLKTLYFYWKQLRGDRFAPARADVDPSDIIAVLPHIGLLESKRLRAATAFDS